MNCLNSVLLEGRISSLPVLENDVYTMHITSHRSYKVLDEDELVDEDSVFLIETSGRLGEVLYKEGKIGRMVRVVGRLKQADIAINTVKVIAEHIEYKPMV